MAKNELRETCIILTPKRVRQYIKMFLGMRV